MTTTFKDAVQFDSTVTWGSGATTTIPANSITNAALTSAAAIARSKLAQDSLLEYNIPYTALRVWDAPHTLLPGTSATDDLGLHDGSGGFGTSAPCVSAGDLKAAGATTRYARFLGIVPAEYVDGETLNIRLRAAVETTVADTSCTADIEAYRLDKDGGISADLCTTAATSFNSLTEANYDFVITPTTLVSGDILDVRITVACNDAATGTAVTPAIYSIALLCDVKG